MKKLYSLTIALIFAFSSSFAGEFANNLIASNTKLSSERTNSEIDNIITNIQNKNFKNFQQKIAYINQIFLNKPYEFNALGEGENGEFDNYPLYRTDAFDCETYVDTVIALALAKDLSSFQKIITQIRYKDGIVSFTNRNHFTCIDWNYNNQKQFITTDITKNITDNNKKKICKDANAIIDKPNWYKNLPLSRIRLNNTNNINKNAKLASLRAKGNEFKKILSTIKYIPLDKVFVDDKINMQIIKQIPNGAIIEIVRPNWDLTKIIGTNLNISHLGFVVFEKDVPYFIHATSEKLMVVKVPLIEYLKKASDSPTIKGINIQIINNN